MWNAYKDSNMILNVDGSSLDNPGVSSLGKFIQNVDSVWVHSFTDNIGYSNILHAVLIA